MSPAARVSSSVGDGVPPVPGQRHGGRQPGLNLIAADLIEPAQRVDVDRDDAGTAWIAAITSLSATGWPNERASNEHRSSKTRLHGRHYGVHHDRHEPSLYWWTWKALCENS